MQVYEQVSDQIEASGAVVLGYVESMGAFKPIAMQTLKNNGIEEVQIDGWYPRQIILNILKEVDGKGGNAAIFQMGKEMANNTQVPDSVKNFEDLVSAAPQVYPLYNRGVPEDKDFIKVEKVGPYRLKFVYHTPYPTQAIKGWLIQMYRRFKKPSDKDLTFELTKGDERDYAREFLVAW